MIGQRKTDGYSVSKSAAKWSSVWFVIVYVSAHALSGTLPPVYAHVVMWVPAIPFAGIGLGIFGMLLNPKPARLRAYSED